MKNKQNSTVILIIFTLLSLQITAQDLIVKNDKTEIKAKIEELTELTIKYRKFDMLDGPAYNINKRDVFMVIYKNGTKEYMEVNKPVSVNNEQSQVNKSGGSFDSDLKKSPNNHSEITKAGKYYQFEGNKINSYNETKAIYIKYGYNDLSKSVTDSRTILNIGKGLGACGALASLLTGRNTWFYVGLASWAGSGFLFDSKFKGTIVEFNGRANRKVSLQKRIEFIPIVARDQMGRHVGLAMRF